MFRIYFLNSIRAIIKDRVFTFVGFAGLIAGNTIFVVIGIWGLYNLSFDKSFPNHNNIYRLSTSEFVGNTPVGSYANTYEGVCSEVASLFPEIRYATKFYTFNADDFRIQYLSDSSGMVTFSDFKGIVADSSFFKIFQLEVVTGDAAENFRYGSVVISEEFAKKYFGNEWMSENRSPIGKVLKVFDGESFDFRVVAVMKNIPKNSHLNFDVAVYEPRKPSDFWVGPLYYTYLILAEGTKVDELQSKMNVWISGLKRNNEKSGDQRAAALSLQSLTTIHMMSHLENELGRNTDWKILLMLLAFALLVLCIAWANFTNLFIARILQRSKEMYLHRVLGARQLSLVIKNGMESSAINLLSLMVAFVILLLSAPYFKKLIGDVDLFESPEILSSVFFTLFLVGTVISFGVSSMVLRSTTTRQQNKRDNKPWKVGWFQRVLIIFQYGISLVLLIVAAGVISQMRFVSQFDLGFDKTNILVLESASWTEEQWSDSAKGFVVSNIYREKSQSFINEVNNYTFVRNSTTMSHVPGENPQWGSEFSVEGSEGSPQPLRCIGVGYHFTQTLGLELVAGRDFSEIYSTDKGNESEGAILINTTALKNLNLGTPSEALHKFLTTFWGARYEIIGVVNSYNQVSLKGSMTPLYYRLEPRAMKYYIMKLNHTGTTNDLDMIKNLWTKLFDGTVEYFFLEDYIETNYSEEHTFVNIVSLFSGSAVLLSALGLFAFTTYVAAMRRKEIGIRKVLGGSTLQILWMLLIWFLKFITIGMLLALPFSYYVLRIWQDQFVFKADISILTYLLPVLLVFAVSVLSIIYESWKASISNPIEVIRHE